MGAAFDEHGRKLAEAQGDSMREVLDSLQKQAPDAAEVRILSGRPPDAPQAGNPEPMLQWFRFDHLPEHLRAVSQPFGVLALRIVENLPRNAERTVALRKLLEAKDAAVRCVLFVG